MNDGRHLSAVQLQWEYFEHAKKYVEREDDTPENQEVLTRWERVLSALETEPLTLHRELDWVAKYRLLAAYRERDGLEWNDPKLQAIDLQYHDVRRERGLYYRLDVRRQGGAPDDRRGGRRRGDGAAGGHPRVLPRAVHLPLPGRDRRGLVGLADRRHGSRCPAAHTDARAAPGHARSTSRTCCSASEDAASLVARLRS